MSKHNTVAKVKKHAAATSASDDSRLLTVEEAALFLRYSASGLNKWRGSGAGPRYIRINGRVRYRASDLAAFVENKSRMSTSEAPAA